MDTEQHLKAKEFEEAARPLIKWLCDNCNPHAKVIVTPVSAELLHGVRATGEILDYIKDYFLNDEDREQIEQILELEPTDVVTAHHLQYLELLYNKFKLR